MTTREICEIAGKSRFVRPRQHLQIPAHLPCYIHVVNRAKTGPFSLGPRTPDPPGMRTDAPEMRTDEPGMRTDEPGMRTDEPGMWTDEHGMRTDAPEMRTDAPGMRTDEPGMRTDEPGMRTDEPEGGRKGEQHRHRPSAFGHCSWSNHHQRPTSNFYECIPRRQRIPQ